MTAYIIAHLQITDPEGFERYREAVPPIVERYGGRYLIRGGAAETLEGEWTVPRLVVLEFADRDAAERFYRSPEYREILPIRLGATTGTAAIVDGV